MARASDEPIMESDCLPDAPHPRFATHFFGNPDAEHELLHAYQSGRLPHAWILGGPKGIGKATLGWRFAKFVLVNPDWRSPNVQNATDLSVRDTAPAVQRLHALGHGDVQIIRREWNDKTKKFFTDIRAEDVRKAVHMFQMASGEGGYRIVILDSADDLNATSANSLLKMIEEPPERALFLIIAHQPNRILPTIRSRCRLVKMQPLSTDDLAKAVRSAMPDAEEPGLRRAVEQAQGSVGEAIRFLDGKHLDLRDRVHALLGSLPRLDWREVHALADSVLTRANDEDLEGLLQTLRDWLSSRIHAGSPAAQLVPYAQAWSMLNEESRITEAYNLDKRAMLMAIFTALADAVSLAQARGGK